MKRLIVAVLSLVYFNLFAANENHGIYQIYTVGNLDETILLNTQTGETWLFTVSRGAIRGGTWSPVEFLARTDCRSLTVPIGTGKTPQEAELNRQSISNQ